MEARAAYSRSGATSLRPLFRLLWAEQLKLAIYVALGVLLGIFYLHIATYKYSATLTVVATQSQSQNLASRFGDIASLAGINLLNNQEISPFTLYTEAITSRAVADDMAVRHPEVLRRTFSNQWDESMSSWRKPNGGLRALLNFAKAIVGIPVVAWAPPGGAELRELIAREVEITPNNKKPIVTLVYQNPDPAFAKAFLDALQDSTDRVLRRMTLDRSSKYARYIENELRTVQQSELRQVLTTSLSQQESLIMMSSSDTPFAAQPLGVTVVSLKPTWPQPIFVLILGIVLGAGFGVADSVGGWQIFPLKARSSRKRN